MKGRVLYCPAPWYELRDLLDQLTPTLDEATERGIRIERRMVELEDVYPILQGRSKYLKLLTHSANGRTETVPILDRVGISKPKGA